MKRLNLLNILKITPVAIVIKKAFQLNAMSPPRTQVKMKAANTTAHPSTNRAQREEIGLGRR